MREGDTKRGLGWGGGVISGSLISGIDIDLPLTPYTKDPLWTIFKFMCMLFV